jgi:hypothetical protein
MKVKILLNSFELKLKRRIVVQILKIHEFSWNFSWKIQIMQFTDTKKNKFLLKFNLNCWLVGFPAFNNNLTRF